MKIKLIVSRAGPSVSQSAGEEIEVGAEEGKRMIDAGQAEAIGATKKETTTRKTAAEKAVKD